MDALLNTLRPEQKVCHPADNHCKYISFNENYFILINNSWSVFMIQFTDTYLRHQAPSCKLLLASTINTFINTFIVTGPKKCPERVD